MALAKAKAILQQIDYYYYLFGLDQIVHGIAGFSKLELKLAAFIYRWNYSGDKAFRTDGKDPEVGLVCLK